VTLSHCWGNSDTGSSHIKTTLANLNDHKSRIQMDQLPKTFRHAVQVVRELGLRHLWIDSLCIVQDDKTDWEAEAALMGRYYKRSLFTIAAALGKNSEAGLFQTRDPLTTRPCALNIGNATFYAYTPDSSFQISKSSLSSTQSKPLSLYGRAWVLQEQLLASRTLTYSGSGVSWRCQGMRFDERAPLAVSIEGVLNDQPRGLMTRGGDPRDVETMVMEVQRNWVFAKRRGYIHRVNCCGHEDHHFFDDWASIVANYTARGMTRYSDRLVAIRGIANEFNAVMAANSEYVAGIWMGPDDCFLKGLLWDVASCSAKRQLDIAPSWSWASVQSKISWGILIKFERSAEVIDVKSSGTVARCSGEVTLRGNVRVGVADKGGKIRLARWPEGVDDDKDLLTRENAVALAVGLTPHHQDATISMDEIMAENTVVYFVEVGTTRLPAWEERMVHVLVVAEGGEHKRRFYRVGLSQWREGFWTQPSVSNQDTGTAASTNLSVGEGNQMDLSLRRREFIIA
jgi:Heterokaryon incompatibility protein (HET)